MRLFRNQKTYDCQNCDRSVRRYSSRIWNMWIHVDGYFSCLIVDSDDNFLFASPKVK